MCILTHLALHTDKPVYLRNKLHHFDTRSEVSVRHAYDTDRLVQPRANREVGKRALAYNAPR